MNKIFLMLALAWCAGGCQSGNSSAPSPTDATLEVRVKAEPRTGAKIEKVDYGSVPSGQWSKTDFDNLDEIVVGVEARTASQGDLAPPKPFDVAARSPLLHAVRRSRLWVRNGGKAAESVFLRTEYGPLIPIGTVQPGQQIAVTNAPAGYVEVCTASRQEPIARLYCYDNGFAEVTHAGETLKFGHLVPGKARIWTWHPRQPGMSKEIVLEAGKVTRCDATVSVNNLPKAK